MCEKVCTFFYLSNLQKETKHHPEWWAEASEGAGVNLNLGPGQSCSESECELSVSEKFVFQKY